MKHVWSHLILIGSAVLLTILLVGLGLAVWLYQSGRLATLSQHLLQRLSGQNVTLDAVEFPSWDTVALLNVRLQQDVSGWRLTVVCPRLEVQYGLTGLLTKQAQHLRVQQPQVVLFHRGDLLPPPPAAPAGFQLPAVLPLRRLTLQQGTLHVQWRNQVQVLHHLEAMLERQEDRQLRVAASGSLADSSATFQLVADTLPGASPPPGHLHFTATAIPLIWLQEVFTPLLPPVWKAVQGTLRVEADLAFQNRTLHGTATTSVEQAMVYAGEVALHQASLTTETRLESNNAAWPLRLEGQTQLQAERLSLASDMTLANVTLAAPWRLSYAPGYWHLTATPAVHSQAAEIGTALRASRLSLTMPMQVQHTAHGLQMQGLPEFTAHTMDVHAGGQTGTAIRISGPHGRLPLHGSATRLEITDARIQTRAWQQQTADATPLLAALTLQGSSAIDLQQQRLTLRHFTVTLPQLGSINGSGEWHWASHTLHELQVQVAPAAVEPLWQTLRTLFPAADQAWHIAGRTALRLRATRLSLRSPRQLQGLTVAWQIDNGAFSNPGNTYAGEHFNGTLQATATFDETSGQYAVHGTLTLQPFALLIGSIFPAFEANGLTSVVTFSGIYSARAEHLQVYVAGQFRDLGMLTLQGVVHRPLSSPQYDLRMHLRDGHAARFWSTFVHDTVRFPTLSQATVQGKLHVGLHLSGQPARVSVQGTLDVAEGLFHTSAVSLRGVSLRLPLQLQYPLPQTAPEASALPADAYGRLSIDALQIGSVAADKLAIRLALWSDNVFVQEAAHLPLLGGQIVLEALTAQHMLQPQRRLLAQLRVHNLDLQRIPRDTARLPLAGVLDGEFSPLLVQGDQLEAQGALTLRIAGGAMRLFDVQGHDLFTGLPTWRCSLTTEQPLSLLRLTNIYPIGEMSGTMDITVSDLTLTAGEPAAFFLEFAVQEDGDEPREITLRALNNLLFTTGSAPAVSGLLGETYRLPYKRFGAEATLRHDVLRLRGKYHDSHGTEYFMQAPALGGGVSIINRVPDNEIPFRDFLQRLKATVLEKPNVQVQ